LLEALLILSYFNFNELSIKDNKIYKANSGSPIGEVKNNKIYKPTSGSPIGDMSKIRREIKDSSIISDAHLVAMYHFLIKPIF